MPIYLSIHPSSTVSKASSIIHRSTQPNTRTHLQSLFDAGVVSFLHRSQVGLLLGRQLRLGPHDSQRDAVAVRGAVGPPVVQLRHLPGLQLTSVVLSLLQLLPGWLGSVTLEETGEKVDEKSVISTPFMCLVNTHHKQEDREDYSEERLEDDLPIDY